MSATLAELLLLYLTELFSDRHRHDGHGKIISRCSASASASVNGRSLPCVEPFLPRLDEPAESDPRYSTSAPMEEMLFINDRFIP